MPVVSGQSLSNRPFDGANMFRRVKGRALPDFAAEIGASELAPGRRLTRRRFGPPNDWQGLHIGGGPSQEKLLCRARSKSSSI